MKLLIEQASDGSLGAINSNTLVVDFTVGTDAYGTIGEYGVSYIDNDGFYCQDYLVTLKNLTDLPSTIIDVSWTIGGYYTNKNEGVCDDQNTIIIVSAPGLDFVTGGGYIIPGDYVDAKGNTQPVTPQGSLLAGKELVRANFGFNAKWANNFRKLTGNFNTIFRLSDGTRYQARTNTASGLVITPLYIDPTDPTTLYGYRADIIYTRVNIRELDCDPLVQTCFSDGNATIVVTVFDYGEPSLDGTFDNVDLIGYAVYGKKGNLYFSTDTYTPSQLVKTEMQPIDNGNIQVHGHPTNLENKSGEITTVTSAITENPVINVTESSLKAYPNPSEGLPVTMEFVLNVDARATLDIMTVSGARVARLFEGDVAAGVMQTAVFDRWTSTGIYVYVLRWNDQMITGKVIITK